MIREASEADIPVLLEMGGRFAAKARLGEHVGFDGPSVEATLRHLITSEDGIVLINGTAAIGGMVHPHPFNLAVKAGQELFWWSEGHDGLKLFEALEEAAKAKGARFWTMITLEALTPASLGRLYERRGYRALEHSYIKEL